MISIRINKKDYIEFNSIEEFYKWIIKNDIDKISSIDDKNACDLYNFIKFYRSIKNICSSNMDEVNKSFYNESDNIIVKDAVEELIRMNSDGKFLRACLIALGYKTFSKSDDNKFLPLASAYETFQTSILIHDDIIDNSSLRRGKITIPKSYNNKFSDYKNSDIDFDRKSNHISNSLGICIGDLGFYLASKIVIDNYSKDKSFNRILDYYNKIVTNTIKGEIIDVLLPFNEQYKKNNRSTIDDIMEIYRLKTAWYSIIGPYSLGMVLAGVSEDKSSKLENILYNLGLAFQIKDDILGIFGDENEIGKSSSSDISEFKQTILYSYVANNNKEMLKELNKYYGRDDLTKSQIDIVKEIFITSGAYEYSNELMKKLFKESEEELNRIDFITEDYKSILSGFMKYLYFRTK